MKLGEWMWVLAGCGLIIMGIGGLMWCGQRVPLDDRGPAVAWWGGLIILFVFGLAGQMYDRGVRDTELNTDDEEMFGPDVG